ncbi:alpha/beta hydrolase family protein [Telluria beijingensis]|uniref:alpha/beta hydrolase family protein n=1 Tax=Telluria beijingensis TaxID=3068633 RepID=UPI0027959632|nr:alpha/beta fold hydrolase [Massilia sp. REN29]
MTITTWRFALAALLAAPTMGLAHAAPAAGQETFDFGAWSMLRTTLPRGEGPRVSYYLSTPKTKAPLVLFVQGWGCTPPFSGLGTDQRSASIFHWVPLAATGRYAVMAVDKPYQPARQDGSAGDVAACGQAFNDYFSYDTWLATLQQALRHALARPEVDATRVLVIGVSEGGALAAGLARTMPEVGAVALSGASGTTQLYDFAARIHQGGGSDADKQRELAAIDTTVRDILADPSSGTKFAWGHPYRRWSSFFAQSAGDNLLQSKARVYVVSGMKDASTPILSTEVMVAQLRGQGRDVTVRRVPAADHDLVPAGGGYEQVQAEYEAIMAWYERK